MLNYFHEKNRHPVSWIQMGDMGYLDKDGNLFVTGRIKGIFLKIKTLQRPGIEPGPPAWQARILPLNHQCSGTDYRDLLTFAAYFHNIFNVTYKN